MGIDVYAHWRGQTKEEKEAQYTGFSIAHGHLGYLREAYHGEPYATRALVPEAFNETLQSAYPEGVPVRAEALRNRLPAALEVAVERERDIYGHDRDDGDTQTILKSFRDFVSLCEERENATGEPCRIVASF